MKWQGRRRSDNVEDRRGMPVAATLGGGGAIIALVVALFFGVDVRPLLQGGGGGAPAGPPAPGAPGGPANTIDDESEAFIATVLADTETVFSTEFPSQLNEPYVPPTLVLFSDRVQSACGLADSAIGPFYCPLDRKVFLDTTFFGQLDQQLGAPGDFAQAYVIAHEVGHHIQQITGISDRVRRNQEGARSQAEANEWSVRLELQADYLAGVWAHHAQQRWQILEPGDIEEALNAAAAIGDDTLQRRSQGTVVPDSFTHGTSAQRVAAFQQGFETGRLDLEGTLR